MHQEVLQAKLESISRELADNKERLDKLERLVEESTTAHRTNAESLQENTRLVKEIKAIVDLGKSFFSVLNYLGIAAKWVGGVAAAIVALYSLIHSDILKK